MTGRKLGWMLCLLPVLLTAFPTQGQSTTSSTTEEIVSSIDPEKWYPGSAVRDALLQVITIGQEEAKRTAEEAVKTAVTPILAENAQLKAERDGYKDTWESAAAGQQRAQAALPWVGVGGGIAGALLEALLSSLMH